MANPEINALLLAELRSRFTVVRESSAQIKTKEVECKNCAAQFTCIGNLKFFAHIASLPYKSQSVLGCSGRLCVTEEDRETYIILKAKVLKIVLESNNEEKKTLSEKKRKQNQISQSSGMSSLSVAFQASENDELT
jgi:hypothetical protein